MSVIGISCGNDGLSYVVIDGQHESPKVIACETCNLKKHVEKGSLLDTAKYSVETAIKKHNVKKAAFLVTDMALRGGITEYCFGGISAAKVDDSVRSIISKIDSRYEA